MGSAPALHFIWGVRCISATGSSAVSALFPRLQGADLPMATRGAAGRALKPALGMAIDIARQDVATGAAVIIRIRTRKRRHRTVRAALRILPGLAGILVAAGQNIGSRIAGKSEIGVRRHG